jgi:glycopeptide antibiotics resistance protein
MILAFAVFGSYQSIARAATQTEGAMPTSGDLCGGTGGNGEIVSVGSSTFTLRMRDGTTRLVNLSNQGTIKTSSGPISLSDLKVGEHVTLVGGPNPDGSFTADTVVLCASAETGSNVTGQGAQATPTRTANLDTAKAWSSNLTTAAILLAGLIWIGMLAFLRVQKRKSIVYLLFFTVFNVYLIAVLNYTLFQFQSLILLKQFAPNLMLNGIAAGKNLNLIPLITLTAADLKTSLLNILLMIPFGFGLPFITTFRMQKVVLTGALVSVMIESLQLVTGLIAHMTFRVADINDVIFNTTGVIVGYVLFIGFIRIYRHLFRTTGMTNPILRYIGERSQIDTQSK